VKPIFAISLVLVAFLPAPSLSPLNEKVLEFARSKKGEMVGDGECTALAREALRFAGAKRFPPADFDEDFVWGTQVDSLEKALPGDVLQFRDAVFKGSKVFPNGAYKTWEIRYPHHTAVVSSVRKMRKGVVLGLLHQNVLNKGDDEDKQKTVREGAVSTAELRAGWVKAYRPVAR